MPIRSYICPSHGEFDQFFRGFQFPARLACPRCGTEAVFVFSAPAMIHVRRDWNEKANEYQRDEYTQAKAQLRNLDREEQERHGKPPMKITERAIQAAAQAIHRGKRQPRESPVLQTKRRLDTLTLEKRRRQARA